MPERLRFHFEPKTGWMNDPNGLIEYRGQIHAFFQHNPYAPKWDRMHWGHAVSDDGLAWRELPIALYPDMPYEDAGGCYSGSAVEKDGKLWLFYTSVSRTLGQTQSCAVSADGVHFEKLLQNPVIPACPIEGCTDFRDPKVFPYQDGFRMVVGSGSGGVGRILLFASEDLVSWRYVGVLFESTAYGRVLECPDLFKLDGKWVLMFSKIGAIERAVQFVVGDFDGERFTPESFCVPEAGPQFYAPQTFRRSDGARILIGWFYDWQRKLDEGADWAGALTIPRRLSLRGNRVCMFPIENAQPLLTDQDALLDIEETRVSVRGKPVGVTLEGGEKVEDVRILRDTKTMEVFVNGGAYSFSFWL